MVTQSSIDDKVCRICASPTRFLHSIIDEYYEHISYATIIQAMCPVRIEKSDDLPKFICFSCEAVVLSSYKLREICVESDRMFRSRSIIMPPMTRLIQPTQPMIQPIQSTQPIQPMIQPIQPIQPPAPAVIKPDLIEIKKELFNSSIDYTAVTEVNDEDDEQLPEINVSISAPTVEKPKKRRGRPPRAANAPKTTKTKTRKIKKKSSRIAVIRENSAKRERRNSVQSKFTKAVSYLARKKKVDHETKEMTVKLHRVPTCDEKSCNFSHIDSTTLQVHKLLDHSGILQIPSQHAYFDVTLRDDVELVARPFGHLCMKDGSQMTMSTAETHLFCKLCINSMGKIVHLDDDKTKFLRHIQENHLDKVAETCRKTRKTKTSPSAVKKSKIKIVLTSKGNKKIINDNHQLYPITLTSLGYWRFVCSKCIKGKKVRAI